MLNYIDQINVFWKLKEEHSFNGNETALYFYLLHKCNTLSWKNPFNNADGFTAAMVCISVNTLKTARNRLKQAGLIDFKPGGAGRYDKCLYTIIPAKQVFKKVSGIDTKAATKKKERYQELTPDIDPNLQPFVDPYQPEIDDNIKHKLNEEVNISDAIASGGQAADETELSKIAEKKEKKVSAQKKKEDATPHWAAIVAVWFEVFKAWHAAGEAPTFDAASRSALVDICANMEARAKKKNAEWTEDYAVRSFRHLLGLALKNKFVKENFLLTNIKLKFDVITNPNNSDNQTNPSATNAGGYRGRGGSINDIQAAERPGSYDSTERV